MLEMATSVINACLLPTHQGLLLFKIFHVHIEFVDRPLGYINIKRSLKQWLLNTQPLLNAHRWIFKSASKAVGSPRPVHLSENLVSSTFLATLLKCDGAPACWNHMQQTSNGTALEQICIHLICQLLSRKMDPMRLLSNYSSPIHLYWTDVETWLQDDMWISLTLLICAMKIEYSISDKCSFVNK